MKTLVLSVSGMHCAGCTETVKALLAVEDGVSTAVVSLEGGTARILYDPALTDADRLARAVERAGYEASPSRE